MRMRVIFAVFFCIPLAVSATTRRVPADYATIQAAVNAAVLNDTVLVSPGDYSANVTIQSKQIVLLAEGGPQITTIRAASPNSPVVTVTSCPRGTIVDGFKIMQSNACGIQCNSSGVMIRNNIITDNRSNGENTGAAVDLNSCQGAVVAGNTMYANTANTYGAAIHDENCTADTARYNIIWGNTGYFDIRYLQSTGAVYNNTIQSVTYAGIVCQGLHINIRNNIVINSPVAGIISADDGNSLAAYNCTYNSGQGIQGSFASKIGNFVTNPLFVDVFSHNFELAPNSPCIDAGDPDPFFDDIDGSRNDVGALYSGPPTKPYPAHLAVLPGTPPLVNSPTPTIVWKYIGPTGTHQEQYEIEVGTNADWTTAELWTSGQVMSTDTAVVYGGPPLDDSRAIYLRIRLHDETQWGDWNGLSFVTHFSPNIRVPQAYSTIQAAIAAATTGDTVLVAAGVYNERIDFLGKAIWVKSESGPSVTTIHSPSSGSPVVRIDKQESRTSVLHGFKIEGASGSFGIFCSGTNPIIQYCEVTANTYSYDGAGIWVNNGAPLIQYNKIYANSSGGTGGGIGGVGSGGFEIQYNEIYNNTASAGGGIGLIYPVSNVKIHHNVVRHNPGTGSYAGGIYVNGSSLKIYNNTVVSNSRGITLLNGGSSQIFNNIVAFNTISGLSPASATISYNDTYANPAGNTPGTNGITADPLFVAPATYDYRLAFGSPCINSGDPNPAYRDPDGSTADIGAFSTIVGDLPVVTGLVARPGVGKFTYSDVPSFQWYYYDTTVGPPAGYEIEIGNDSDWVSAEVWSSGQVFSTDTFAIYGGTPLADGGRYWLRIRVNNGLEWGGWCPFTFTVKLPGPWRVPLHAARISDLLSYAVAGDSIVLSPGVYSDNFSLSGMDLVITSDSGWQQTILQSASPNWPVAEFKSGVGRNTIFERISVRGARNAPGIQITNSSPTIRNCEATDNQGPFGGIALSSAGPQITNCYLHDNTSTNTGAGIGGSISGTVELGYNLVRDNHGVGGGIGLGGSGVIDIHHNIVLRNFGSVSSAGISCSYFNGLVRNNTVVSNDIGISSALASSVYIVNNIVLANSGDGIVVGASAFDFNDTWNNGRDLVPNKSNINADPKFKDTVAGDFSLLEESPCIDAGDPSAAYFDPDGSRADMGAIPRDQTGLARVVAFTLLDEVLSHVVSQTPSFSWSATFPGGMSQQAYEVQVGGDPDWEYAEYWEPGIVSSTDTSVAYAGAHMREGLMVYCRVRVFDGTAWTSWYNFTFHTDNRPLAPTLNLPVDTNVVAVNKPDLSALMGEDKDGDQQKLQFEVYRDSLLQNVRVTSPLLGASQYVPVVWTVTAPLIENSRYWWRVRSWDGYAFGSWSLTRSLWINQLSEHPTAPVLTSPIEQADGPEYDLTPAFVWGEGDDPDPKDTVRYTVQISLNDTFTLAFTYPDLLEKTFVENDSLPVSIHFWWRVIATDRDGHSEMSPAGQFTTYSPGDVDHSGYPDLADLALMIDYLYISRTPFSPLWAGDVDGDCSVDIADITRLIDYLYLTYYPLSAGCGVSATTGQQFLKKLGAEVIKETGKLPVAKRVTKPAVLAPTQLRIIF